MLPDSVFDGSLEEHYGDILKAADIEQVKANIFGYFRKLAVLEKVIEDNKLEESVQMLQYSDDPVLDDRVNDFIIESMSTIVVNHER